VLGRRKSVEFENVDKKLPEIYLACGFRAGELRAKRTSDLNAFKLGDRMP